MRLLLPFAVLAAFCVAVSSTPGNPAPQENSALSRDKHVRFRPQDDGALYAPQTLTNAPHAYMDRLKKQEERKVRPKDDSIVPRKTLPKDSTFYAPESMRFNPKRASEHQSVGELFKKAFRKCGVKIKRTSSKGKGKLNKALQKVSKAEKKIHKLLADKLERAYKLVARTLSKTYQTFSVFLEPILGERIVFAMDRIVGGAVVLSKKIGKFVVDHIARIAGIAVGLLVGIGVTAGLTMLTLNPILAGAIGGAVGAFSNVAVTHILGAAIRGNMVPTSLEEAGVRAKRFGLELGAAIVIGGGVGAATAGIAAGFAQVGSSAVRTVGTFSTKAGAGVGRAAMMGGVRQAIENEGAASGAAKAIGTAA